MTTPRQKALIGTINNMYSLNMRHTLENVLESIGNIFHIADKQTKTYISNMSFVSEEQFKTEVLYYLKKGIILDELDFTPGGQYEGFRNNYSGKI